MTQDQPPDMELFARWLRRQGISRSHGYVLIAQGKAPETIKVGGRRYVTRRAVVAWEARLAAETAERDRAHYERGAAA